MGVLISGIIGAVVSVAAWLGLESVIEKEFGWLAIGVGLVTGFAIHAAATKPRQKGFARGALAAVLSLAAIGLGPLAKAEIMKSMNNAPQKIADVSVKVTPEEQEDGEPAEKPAQAERVSLESRDVMAGDGKVTIGKPNKDTMTDMDMIWICASAMVAYLVGKGSDEVAVSEGDEASPEQEPEAETPEQEEA